MMAFLGGVCVGVMLISVASFLIFRWMVKHLSAEDTSSLVIDEEAFEGDK
jgi:hypothetical protein